MTGPEEPERIDVDSIEAEAARALAGVPEWIWDGESYPVPLEAIVDSHYMLLVREVEDFSRAPGFPADEDAPISGLLLTTLGEIWVSYEEARQWPARRRFTIGHELGHWLLHRSGQQSMFCRHTSVDQPHPDQLRLETERAGTVPSNSLKPAPAPPRPAPVPDPDLPLSEAEANAFAAAILMPRDRFVHEYRRSRGDIEYLQRCFGCSEKATQRRIAAVIR